MMIRVQRVTSVAEFLKTMKQRYGDNKQFRAYVRSHPRDITAKLDLEDYEFYLVHPEMHHEKMERAVSLLPVSAKALSMFTKQRLSMLETLAYHHFASVRKLAEHLGRDVHNVYEDLSLFRKLGIVEFERGPRNSRIPHLAADSINIVPKTTDISEVEKIAGSEKVDLDVYLAEDILQGEEVPFYLLWKGAELEAIELEFSGFSSLTKLFNVDDRVHLPNGGRIPKNAFMSTGYVGGLLATSLTDNPYLQASLTARVWLQDGLSRVFTMNRTLHSVRVNRLSMPEIIRIPMSDPKELVEVDLNGAATVMIGLKPLEETSVKLGLPKEVLSAMEKFVSAAIEGIGSLVGEFPEHSELIASLTNIPENVSMREYFDSLVSRIEVAKQDESFTEALAMVFVGALLGQATVRDSVLLPLMEYFEANVSTKAYLKSPFLSAWVPAGGGVLVCELILEDLRNSPCGDPVLVRTRIESETEQIVPIKDLLRIRRG